MRELIDRTISDWFALGLHAKTLETMELNVSWLWGTLFPRSFYVQIRTWLHVHQVRHGEAQVNLVDVYASVHKLLKLGAYGGIRNTASAVRGCHAYRLYHAEV
jgi:hypothetical protein